MLSLLLKNVPFGTSNQNITRKDNNMKTKFVAISLFFFTIFSSLPAYAESFISANPNVRIIILTFVGKNGTEKKAVPVFRHPLGMEIPSTVTGGAPIRFSYRLVPTVMTINEAMHMTKKDKKNKSRCRFGVKQRTRSYFH